MVVFRNRESDLQKKWSEKNDLINVNKDQYYLSSQEKEDSFYNDPYTSKEDKIKFKEYREEWFRRPKEFDAGDKPLAVNCELVSTCNLACTMCYTITDKFQNSVVGAQRIMPWKIVKKIIEEHGGTFRLEDAPKYKNSSNVGAAAIIELPLFTINEN